MFLPTYFSLPCNRMNHGGLFSLGAGASQTQLLEEIQVKIRDTRDGPDSAGSANTPIPVKHWGFVCLFELGDSAHSWVVFRNLHGLNAWLSQSLDFCPQSHLHHTTCWTRSCYKHLSSKTPNISQKKSTFLEPCGWANFMCNHVELTPDLIRKLLLGKKPNHLPYLIVCISKVCVSARSVFFLKLQQFCIRICVPAATSQQEQVLDLALPDQNLQRNAGGITRHRTLESSGS